MKILFIGTGLMGAPMAQKLLESGQDVTVYNRDIKKAEALKSFGAKIEESLKTAFSGIDIIVFMVSDYNAIRSLLDCINKKDLMGKTVIQMSTISPKENIMLENELNGIGCNFMEAPVLGSISQIQQKTLIVLVGSSAPLFELHKDLFTSFSNRIDHVGGVGKASALKLGLNQLIIGLTSVFTMSLGFIRENNIDINLFMDIVRQSALYAPTFDKKLNNYLERDFSNPNFPLKHLLKDLNLIEAAFSEKNINTETLKGIRIILQESVNSGMGDLDYSALYNTVHKNPSET
ncbi:MAG: hydroxyacid dehydrogenase [Ignavibacteriae bacterium HGW-Ignavibacteriae-2]|jgi:3-hydroxyisobutyrate dehydrogenase|nr:MAG: hydroxyacid dehydrogenase [Ignavibacteriae bacterium HGW-Ignavibacteriae-2]